MINKMILFWSQVFLDFLLFSIYLSMSITIFITYFRSEVSKVSELFPNLWILGGLFFLFRALQKGFEVLSQFSLLDIERSIMEILFKSIILVILVLILKTMRQNYDYFIRVSRLMVEVHRRMDNEKIDEKVNNRAKTEKEG